MLKTNPKKPITLKNNTNYFNPATSRIKNTFSSPNSYQSREIKIEGYETRLYWQFRYCEENNGQTFFYTLTYNDSNIPTAYGTNCFDYNDLRELLIGGFQKQLLRKYGTKFKYFVGAELGDGKGKRGMHNNPHYHILFFLEDAQNPRFPYIKITPEDFRTLIKRYWQGFDENVDGYHDYNSARKGIAKEGENCGKVTDCRACMYCAKYVCKDAKLVANEGKVVKNAKMYFRRIYKPFQDEDYHETGHLNYHYANEVARAFFNEVIVPMYKRYLTPHYGIGKKKDTLIPALTNSQLISKICPDLPFSTVVFNDEFVSLNYHEDGDLFLDEFDEKVNLADSASWYLMIEQLTKKLGMWQNFCDFRRQYIEPKIKERVNEWRNRYSNKVRISQGVGDYALSTIDKLNPSVQVPDTKKGFKNRPLPMYFYRKLYMNVVKDEKGQNIYILNDDGVEYKLHNLSKQINRKVKKAKSFVDMLLGNEELYEKIRESDANTTCFWHYNDFFKKYNYLLNENEITIDKVYERYAEYKLVYENRFFTYNDLAGSNIDSMPPISVLTDYSRFISPSYYTVAYNPDSLSEFISHTPEMWLPYCQHPYFLRYIGFFSMLDMCSDYFFIQKDNKSQKEAEERANTRRFHNERKLKEFYSAFQNNVLFINKEEKISF